MNHSPVVVAPPPRSNPIRCQVCLAQGGGLCGLVGDEKGGPVPVRRPPRQLARGADLMRLGDPVTDSYTVLSGWLFSYALLEDGRRQIIGFVLPGEVIDTAGESGAASIGVQSLTSSVVCEIANGWLFGRLATEPGAARRLLAHSRRQQLLVYGQLTSLGRRTAFERVAYLLLELTLRLRDPARPGMDDGLPLTQGHIADGLGLTSVHVNRILRRLQDQGAITYVRRRLHVLDLQGLCKAAGVGQDPLFSALADGSVRPDDTLRNCRRS